MLSVFIKEMRQLRRNVPVWSVLALQVIVGLVMLIRIAILHIAGDSTETTVFGAINFLAGVVSIGTVIGTAAARWVRERGDDFLNPGRTTPLSPFAITAGKFLATWCALLIPLAVMQLFMLFPGPTLPPGYWKSGVPLILLYVFSIASLVLAATSAGRRKVSHGAGVSIAVLAVVFLLPSAIGFASALFERVCANEEVYPQLRFFWPVIMLSFMLAAAAVAPPRSDRMLPVRIAVLASVLILTWMPPVDRGTVSQQCVLWLLVAAKFTTVSALLERRRQSRRVVAEIRRVPRLWRPLRALFSTGAVPGLVFALVLALAAFAVGVLTPGDFLRDRGREISGGFALFFFYSSLTLFIIEMWDKFLHRALDAAKFSVVVWLVCQILPLAGGLDSSGALSLIALWHDFDNPGAWYEIGGLLAVSVILLMPTVCGFARSYRAAIDG